MTPAEINDRIEATRAALEAAIMEWLTASRSETGRICIARMQIEDKLT